MPPNYVYVDIHRALTRWTSSIKEGTALGQAFTVFPEQVVQTGDTVSAVSRAVCRVDRTRCMVAVGYRLIDQSFIYSTEIGRKTKQAAPTEVLSKTEKTVAVYSPEFGEVFMAQAEYPTDYYGFRNMVTTCYYPLLLPHFDYKICGDPMPYDHALRANMCKVDPLPYRKSIYGCLIREDPSILKEVAAKITSDVDSLEPDVLMLLILKNILTKEAREYIFDKIDSFGYPSGILGAALKRMHAFSTY